jgi:hypothetical protein
VSNNVRRSAALLLAAVFVVGVIGGLALEEVVDDWAWVERLENEGDPEDMEDAEELILERLRLDPDQEERIERILDAREDRIEQYWVEQLPAIRALIDSTRAEIRAVLTPAQRAEYDRRVRELQASFPPDPG